VWPYLLLAHRAFRAGPRGLARRIGREASREFERLRLSRAGRHFDSTDLFRATGAEGIGALWEILAARPFPVVTKAASARALASAHPEERDRVIAAADAATARRVDILGSGPFELGRPIDWHRDFKSGMRWPLTYGPRLAIMQLDRPSDVKVPWELSRLQWLIPVGQAYLLTGDDRYAATIRDVLDEWIGANPCPLGVNWVIAMEAALRILSWTWFFHVCARSGPWQDEAFQERFLTTLYLHADFVEHGLERAEVNGNHLDADAVGLVFAGSFFGHGRAAERWQKLGWRILAEEIVRQVTPDGVDFEASSAYHRLVFEFFFLAARYRTVAGLDVPAAYRGRLRAMGEFAAAYSRPDGSAPLWGDNDDGRALPLGGQTLFDHRYVAELAASVSAASGNTGAAESITASPASETLWILGLDPRPRAVTLPGSSAFPHAGVYVMRSDRDYVFIDGGPVGFAGRGGHGHNDCLSIDATLAGDHLLSDCGSYVYTASVEWRNRFRSSSAHNSPVLDGEEQNRFIRPEFLWLLENDARPRVDLWTTSPSTDTFRGTHIGYRRLADPVDVTRTVVLDRLRHRLAIADRFAGAAEHQVTVRFHLSPSVRVQSASQGHVVLRVAERNYSFVWAEGPEWILDVGDSWVSPSYGRRQPSVCLELSRRGQLRPLLVAIAPESEHDGLIQWAGVAGR
jgi:uncharacterized heparinase superfamily protein